MAQSWILVEIYFPSIKGEQLNNLQLEGRMNKSENHGSQIITNPLKSVSFFG
jgi:hypothetical protein